MFFFLWVSSLNFTFQARGYDNGLSCSKVEVCENCMDFDDAKCYQPKIFNKYT